MSDPLTAEVRPVQLHLELASAASTLHVACTRCRNLVPHAGGRNVRRNGFTGKPCRRCPNVMFLGTCAQHGGLVAVGTDEMRELGAGRSVPCPLPRCAARLTLPRTPSTSA
jgi:hypothetical protein